jgi:hypothetical protein
MEVQVSPDYAPREEYGYIYGKIEKVGENPVTPREIVKNFGSVQYVQGLIPQGNVIEISVVLDSNAAGLKWSNKKGKSISVTNGSYCNVLIVTRERKPYELIL